MNTALFRGSGTALATPFLHGDVDYAALGRMIDRQLEAGTDALIVLGTTGEPPTLTAEEKECILAFAVERTAGRIPIIAGCGGNSTRELARRARQMQKTGADALLTVTPYYNKTTQAGLTAHYTAIADAVTIPVILYNVPSRTGMNLLPETAARLAEHPNIRGIKEAGGNISQIAELAALTHDTLALYSGNDDQTLPILSLGGQGVISVAGNIIPRQMRALTHSWLSGDTARARTLQWAILPLVRELFREVNPIPLKAALNMMDLCTDETRLPLVPLNEAYRAALRTALTEALAAEPEP